MALGAAAAVQALEIATALSGGSCGLAHRHGTPAVVERVRGAAAVSATTTSGWVSQIAGAPVGKSVAILTRRRPTSRRVPCSATSFHNPGTTAPATN